MKFTGKKTVVAACGIAILAVLAAICKPGDRGGGYDAYFAAMNESLKKAGIAQPVIFLDLDRLDANIARVMQAVKPPLNYRIVVKSLPSLDLLRYVMERTGSRRLMPFHLSHMRAIIECGIPGIDMLPGRPFPAAAVERFYDSLPVHRRTGALRAIRWLVDSEERISEYLAFAARRGIRLRLNIELDVGLHRGGAASNEELARMLAVIAAHPDRLVFSGFMGYDGHVAHVPLYLGSKEGAVRREFGRVMDRYREFIAFGRNRFPALFTGDITFNGGGSTTYALYDASSPVNDVAAGSCLVMPSTFDVFTLTRHRPALFTAAPVLKRLRGFGVPFIEAFHGLVEWWDPNVQVTFYTSGGGWSDVILSPAGVSINALTASPPNENMLPNQSMLNGSRRVAALPGDFIFYHPLQGDAMMQFDELLVIRGERITARWRPFAARI